MRKNFLLGLLISLGFPFLASAVNAQTPNFAFTGSGSWLNSTSNFNSDFTPGSKSANVWTNTFSTLGTGIASNDTSTVTENSEYTTAAPGSGKFAPPQAGAATITHTDTVTGQNSDGSFTVQVGTLTETYTAGPQTGLTATVTFPTTLTVKQWRGTNGTYVMAGTSPVVETVTLSNGTIWYRICVRSVVVTPLQ